MLNPLETLTFWVIVNHFKILATEVLTYSLNSFVYSFPFTSKKICAASEKKCPAGLDNTTIEGVMAIQTLQGVAEKLSEAGDKK